MPPWPVSLRTWPSLWPRISSTTATDAPVHSIRRHMPASVVTAGACQQHRHSATVCAARWQTIAPPGASTSHAQEKREDKTRVFGQPGLHLLALVPPQMVEHHVHHGDRRGNCALQLRQKRDACPLRLRSAVVAYTCPVRVAKPAQRCSAPLRLYSYSTRSGCPGCAASGGAVRGRGCQLVFSSTPSTIAHTPRGRV